MTASPKEKMQRGFEGPLTLGSSIRIKGRLAADRDLIIDFVVEGTVTVGGHSVVVGANGRAGDIHAGTVVVNGTVAGDITAGRRIEVAASGSVTGGLRAPSVVLAEGAQVNGRVSIEG